METFREGTSRTFSKEELVGIVRSKQPHLFDDDEPCYPGCKNRHPKWRHEFDRSLYDLTATIPRKIYSDGRGSYTLN